MPDEIPKPSDEEFEAKPKNYDLAQITAEKGTATEEVSVKEGLTRRDFFKFLGKTEAAIIGGAFAATKVGEAAERTFYTNENKMAFIKDLGLDLTPFSEDEKIEIQELLENPQVTLRDFKFYLMGKGCPIDREGNHLFNSIEEKR